MSTLEATDEYGKEYPRLEEQEAKQFANLSFDKFNSSSEWGPAQVLEYAAIISTAWRRLPHHVMSSFDRRLSRNYNGVDIEFLCELGKRQAIANAALSDFSASAKLELLSQPSATFDRFLAIAKQQDRMAPFVLKSAIAKSRTFPRDAWLGLPVND